MKIIKCNEKDALALTELTHRSKNYWNYGKEQIEAWKDELTLTQAYIRENQVFKLVDDDLLIGFYAYNAENQNDIKLNYLFVEPNCIGKGYGKTLVNDFLKSIKNSKYQRVILDADPNAEKFYQSFGFRTIGKLETSIKNRFLPIMQLNMNTLK